MKRKEFTGREINIALDPSWTPTNLQVIFKKIDETRFRVCGIRYRFGGDPVQKLYGIFDYSIIVTEMQNMQSCYTMLLFSGSDRSLPDMTRRTVLTMKRRYFLKLRYWKISFLPSMSKRSSHTVILRN